jgi:hypothetical protein
MTYLGSFTPGICTHSSRGLPPSMLLWLQQAPFSFGPIPILMQQAMIAIQVPKRRCHSCGWGMDWTPSFETFVAENVTRSRLTSLCELLCQWGRKCLTVLRIPTQRSPLGLCAVGCEYFQALPTKVAKRVHKNGRICYFTLFILYNFKKKSKHRMIRQKLCYAAGARRKSSMRARKIPR